MTYEQRLAERQRLWREQNEFVRENMMWHPDNTEKALRAGVQKAQGVGSPNWDEEELKKRVTTNQAGVSKINALKDEKRDLFLALQFCLARLDAEREVRGKLEREIA